MRLLNVFVGSIAAMGFAVALVIHALTFVPVDVDAAFPAVWSLHVGCFVVFIPFFLAARRDLGARPDLSALRSVLPAWASALLAVVLAYAVLNFVLLILHTEGGVPAKSGGGFVLQSHGKVIRQLSEAEYHLQKAYVVRGFSGHWLVFYLLPALYLLLARRTQQVNAGASRGSAQ